MDFDRERLAVAISAIAVSRLHTDVVVHAVLAASALDTAKYWRLSKHVERAKILEDKQYKA
jgi:dimeric dUTPase (all-alpha-NTP-PPase superfamily)